MAETTVEVPKEASNAEEKPLPVKSLKEDAFHNFIQGKRHMLVKDYSHAVQSLADACELYVEHYGALAPECGEVYFLYGKALFSFFQQQAGIFGDAVPDDGEEDDEEENDGSEDDKEEEEDKKAEEENEDSNSNDCKEDDSESISSSKDGEKSEAGKCDSGAENNTNDNEPTSTSDSSALDATVSKAKTESNEANEASEANGSIDEIKNNNDVAEAGPSQSKEKTEDEISDLQLAWENLETAKSIFQRKGNEKENELKVAEILLLLGEISLECDNYDAAIRDLKDGLAIWQKHLSADDRRIAETFYQLGLAHQLNNQADRALDFFQHTIDVILLRINILKNQTEIKQNEDGFDIDPSIEIADLEALLPDIKSKMEDTKDLDKDAKKAMQELVAQKIEEVNVTSTSDEKPVTNINHLLKRKKPEEPDSAKTEEVKKIKLSSPARNVEDQRPSSSEATASPPRA